MLPKRLTIQIDQDQFEEWLSNPVTQVFFNDLEDTYLDSCIAHLPIHTMDQFTIAALKREGHKELIDIIARWAPAGCRHKEEKEDA